MKFPFCALAFVTTLILAVYGQNESAAKTSERGDMSRDLILEEAATHGYSGDSINLDFSAPCSVVMRLYLIAGGETKLIQSSKPTMPSKSFEIGFLYRPHKKKGRELSFIFYDHDRPTKGIGSNLPIEQSAPYHITEKFSYSLSAMGAARKIGETVVFYTTETGLVDNADTLEQTAKGMGSGYVITATLSQQSEQEEAD